MAGLSIYAAVKVAEINSNLETINDVNSVKQRFAINYRGSVHDRAIAIRDVTLVTSSDERKAAEALIEKLAASYAENEKRMADMVASPAGATDQEKSILKEIADIQAKTNPLSPRSSRCRRRVTVRLPARSCSNKPGRTSLPGSAPSTNSSTTRKH